jgi:Tol biopolymer transport system component
LGAAGAERSHSVSIALPYNAVVRSLILSGVIVSGISAILFGRQAATPAVDLPQLSYVTTAHQLGVVGYRDPAGAISPDGTRLAYTEGRFIRVVPIGGGVPVTLAAGEGQIRTLVWRTNNTIAAQDLGRWWLYPLDREGRALLREDGGQLAAQAAGGTVACLVNRKLTIPCGGAPVKLDLDRDLYGPIAHSPDGNTIYLSAPNDRGMVELMAADVTSRRTRRLSSFNRDAYAPSVAADGTVVFKTQTYRTHLADVPFEGGPTRQLTTFQSETPSYHPTRPLIAFTYGSWRRVIDDAKYPDIAQEIGTIDVTQLLPHSKPSEVLEESDSEDQAMSWSPNGKWIAFHTHKEMSDDVWLRPADGAQPDKRITFLGRGAEVGWPRWSPDGRTVLLNGARKSDGASVLYAIGVDQHSGSVTSELREIKIAGITGEMGHAEWMPNSTTVIAIAKEGPGRHVIFTAPAGGGRATVVHRVNTEHDFPGLGVSSNGRFVAFVAPAPDGFFQIFVKAIGATTPPAQLTTDRSHKTQPTFAPDNSRVAFTVWTYEAAFWSFKQP